MISISPLTNKFGFILKAFISPFMMLKASVLRDFISLTSLQIFKLNLPIESKLIYHRFGRIDIDTAKLVFSSANYLRLAPLQILPIGRICRFWPKLLFKLHLVH